MSWDPEQWKLTQEQEKARNHLKWAEGEMSKAAMQVRKAICEVHDLKSWRFDYPSFEDYCKQRLGLSERRAYQILKGESVRAILLGSSDEEGARLVEGLNETHLRELNGVEPERALEVVKQVSREGKMSAKKLAAKLTSRAPERMNKNLSIILSLLQEETGRGPITEDNYEQAAERISEKILTIRTKAIDLPVNTK